MTTKQTVSFFTDPNTTNTITYIYDHDDRYATIEISNGVGFGLDAGFISGLDASNNVSGGFRATHFIDTGITQASFFANIDTVLGMEADIAELSFTFQPNEKITVTAGSDFLVHDIDINSLDLVQFKNGLKEYVDNVLAEYSEISNEIKDQYTGELDQAGPNTNIPAPDNWSGDAEQSGFNTNIPGKNTFSPSNSDPISSQSTLFTTEAQPAQGLTYLGPDSYTWESIQTPGIQEMADFESWMDAEVGKIEYQNNIAQLDADVAYWTEQAHLAELSEAHRGIVGVREAGTGNSSYDPNKNGNLHLGSGTARPDGKTFNHGSFNVGGVNFNDPRNIGTKNTGKPIVVDLDNDGVELVDFSASTAFYDINGDGYRNLTGWVGADDGFLALDKDGDGIIDQHNEIAFASYVEGATTDIEGLKFFDTHHSDGTEGADGILDAADEQWASFGVWQDLDQDGVTDVGEFRSLDDAGITSIELTTDGNIVAVESTTVTGTGMGTDINKYTRVPTAIELPQAA